MSYLYVDKLDAESQELLLEFARKRIGKVVAVSLNAKDLKGNHATTEPVNLLIDNVLGSDIYFRVKLEDIASLDDQPY